MKHYLTVSLMLMLAVVFGSASAWASVTDEVKTNRRPGSLDCL